MKRLATIYFDTHLEYDLHVPPLAILEPPYQQSVEGQPRWMPRAQRAQGVHPILMFDILVIAAEPRLCLLK
jgi:hypothetical protein